MSQREVKIISIMATSLHLSHPCVNPLQNRFHMRELPMPSEANTISKNKSLIKEA
jgi:hypothetical protein